MRSLAEIDQEPRIVDFEITDVCPGEWVNPGAFEKYKSRLPIKITVHWPAGEPNYSKYPKCDGDHYRVTDESLAALGREGRVWVCEHMGRLVE